MRPMKTAALATSLFLLAAADARAGGAFVVNQKGDESDLVAGGACDISANPGDQCTLRAAIQAGDENPGFNTVSFLFAGAGPHTIELESSLPAINDPVLINGYSQPGSVSNDSGFPLPLTTGIQIFLDGKEVANGSSGLTFEGGSNGSVVRGLAIGNVDGAGIQALAPVTVEGNFIGTNAAGTRKRPNDVGLLVLGAGAANTVIGGPDFSDPNLISGNRQQAIVATTALTAEGNYIGVARDGKTLLPNTTQGDIFAVTLAGDGSDELYRNIIAGGSGGGVEIPEDNAGSLVSANRMFKNDGLGIELGDDGVTANDALDPDSGPNTLQNFPKITKAKRLQTTTMIEGTFNSLPNEGFIIEIYQADGKSRQGKVYLGGAGFTTDDDGNYDFDLEFIKPKKGKYVTATATRIAAGDLGATSEFAKPREVR